MVTSVYLASSEGLSGKSAVALGILEQLSRRVGRVGVFRPIVRERDASRDHVLDLLLSRIDTDLTPESASGVGYDDVHADPEQALSTIVDRFHAVADDFEAMLIIGSDYTDVTSPTELSYNARIAANLGAPMVLVVTGTDRSAAQIRTAADITADEARAQHARVLAVVANRVAPSEFQATQALLIGVAGDAPTYAIPGDSMLNAPTVRDLMGAVGGTHVAGDDALLDRESLGLVVAAMTLPNVLDRLFEGAVVITPSDRGDVLLGLLLAHRSKTLPSPSGIVLNGGFALPGPIATLVEGLDVHVPIITCPTGTMATTSALHAVAPRLTRSSTRKIETALRLFDEHIDGADLLDRLDVSPSSVVTPLMFEHLLLDRASPQPTNSCADASCGSPCSATRTTSVDGPGSWASTSRGRPCWILATSRCGDASRRSMRSCGLTRASPSSRPATWSST